MGAGLWQWSQQQSAQAAPRQLVEQFATALQQGDRASILQMMTPAMRERAQAHSETDIMGAWQPTNKLSWDIKFPAVTSTSATAELHLQEEGYRLTAQLGLRHTTAHGWQLDDLELVKIDSRWESAQRRAEHARLVDQALSDEALAMELRRAVERMQNIAETPTADQPAQRR